MPRLTRDATAAVRAINTFGRGSARIEEEEVVDGPISDAHRPDVADKGGPYGNMVGEAAASDSEGACSRDSRSAAVGCGEDARDEVVYARGDDGDETRDDDETREEGAPGEDARADDEDDAPDEDRGVVHPLGTTAATAAASSKDEDADAVWEDDATLPAGVMTEMEDSVRSGGDSAPPSDAVATTGGDGRRLRGASAGGGHTTMLIIT